MLVTDDFAGRILSLPLANDLGDDDIDRIVACVLGAVGASGLEGSAQVPG
jgi:dTDP-4-amino-4,6-dideoxygalactose transaminase